MIETSSYFSYIKLVTKNIKAYKNYLLNYQNIFYPAKLQIAPLNNAVGLFNEAIFRKSPKSKLYQIVRLLQNLTNNCHEIHVSVFHHIHRFYLSHFIHSSYFNTFFCCIK